jgi:hypothetical protein
MPPPERVDAPAGESSPLPPADSAASRPWLGERDGERRGEESGEPTKTSVNRTKRAEGAYTKRARVYPYIPTPLRAPSTGNHEKAYDPTTLHPCNPVTLAPFNHRNPKPIEQPYTGCVPHSI